MWLPRFRACEHLPLPINTHRVYPATGSGEAEALMRANPGWTGVGSTARCGSTTGVEPSPSLTLLLSSPTARSCSPFVGRERPSLTLAAIKGLKGLLCACVAFSLIHGQSEVETRKLYVHTIALSDVHSHHCDVHVSSFPGVCSATFIYKAFQNTKFNPSHV